MFHQWTIYSHLNLCAYYRWHWPTQKQKKRMFHQNQNHCSPSTALSSFFLLPTPTKFRAASTAMDGITTPCFEADLRPEDWEITFSRRVFKVGTGRKTRWAHFWLDSLWPYLFLRGPWQFLAERGRKTFYPPPPKQVAQKHQHVERTQCLSLFLLLDYW